MRMGRVLPAVAAGLLLWAALPALAKGASGATIVGEGLDGPIVLEENGEPGTGTRLARLAEESKFFEQVWGSDDADSRLTAAPPEETLGPMLEVRYLLPIGPDEAVAVIQAIYPRADGGAVSYMAPGQDLGSEYQTAGGWHRAGPGLGAVLSSVGVPASVLPAASVGQPAVPAAQPTGGESGDPTGWERAFPWVAAAVLALLGGLVWWRRRPPATGSP